MGAGSFTPAPIFKRRYMSYERGQCFNFKCGFGRNIEHHIACIDSIQYEGTNNFKVSGWGVMEYKQGQCFNIKCFGAAKPVYISKVRFERRPYQLTIPTRGRLVINCPTCKRNRYCEKLWHPDEFKKVSSRLELEDEIIFKLEYGI